MTELMMDTAVADYSIGPPPKSGRGRIAEPERPHSAGNMGREEESDGNLLPALRSSSVVIDSAAPLPTSLQSDFLPDDVMQALSKQGPAPNKLGPPTRYRNLNVTTGVGRKPAANVWAFPSRREKFKHLTESTPCICGAGKDVSFLYDVPKKQEKAEKPSKTDPSGERTQELEGQPRKPGLQLPDTLIPEEYHVVKNKGVMGLEYHEDEFTTQPEDHESHLVVFPSMNPTSRYEVMQLQRTLQDLLDKVGVNELEDELKGPTQMHNLLALIKKEQDIYNLVFHELIRQSSIECVERGQLLAELRGNYNQLLNKVPRQVKGLHEEVLAQRALDRRLTEELMRFKTTISSLTSELSTVKAHDQQVTKQAQTVQEDLKAALNESHKNASLLAEYHDLYELQRRRLQGQVQQLSDEREIWSTAAYSLALKVMEEHSLNTAKRLHVSEKAWAKLANHFAIVLSDKDTETMATLQGFVDHFRDEIEVFHKDLLSREADTVSELHTVKASIAMWVREFEDAFLGTEGQLVKVPDAEVVADIYGNVKSWAEVLTTQAETFGGDLLLTGQEALLVIHKQMDGWTESGLQAFGRHRTEAGDNHPDHDDMILLNEQVDGLLRQYQIRLTGENGIAAGLIHLSNHMETWENRLMAVVHGSNPLPEQEWVRFYQMLADWITCIEETVGYSGLTQREEDRNEGKEHIVIELVEVMRMTQKWLSSSTNGVDSEDAKLVEAVSGLHTEMVKWMVHMLLRLAPDQQHHSEESKHSALLGNASIGQLQADAKSLFDRLGRFSRYLSLCCNGIVMNDMQKRLENHEENADHEYRDLQKLQSECDDWIRTAELMLCELTGEPFPEGSMKETSHAALDAETSFPALKDDEKASYADEEAVQQEGAQTEGATAGEDQSEDAKTTKAPEAEGGAADREATPQRKISDGSAPVETTVQEEAEEEEEEEEPEEGENLEMIGFDDNTRTVPLIQDADQAPSANVPVMEVAKEDAPTTKRAYEALGAVEALQTQLIETEERAQEAEERASMFQAELAAAEERMRQLERKLDGTPDNVEAIISVTAKPKSASSAATHGSEDGNDHPDQKETKKKKVPTATLR